MMKNMIHETKPSKEWFAQYPSTKGFDGHLTYFKQGTEDNKIFWRCFGGERDFSNQSVLDVGCGHGSLCIDTALANPTAKVIGLDIDSERIDFARWNLHVNYPALESRVSFHCADIQKFPIWEIDAFLSKASFEHIFNLREVLEAIYLRLKPGGKLYTGFDPLYYSPYGGHGRIHNSLPFPWLPWGHVLLPEWSVLNFVNRYREPERAVSSIAELGLNKLSVDQFLNYFEETGFRIVSFDTNLPGGKWKTAVLSSLGRVGFLRKYMIYSIYSVLEKPE